MSKFFKSLLLLLSAGLFTATGWAETIAVNQEIIGINFTTSGKLMSADANSTEEWGYYSQEKSQGGLLAENKWQNFTSLTQNESYPIQTVDNLGLSIQLEKLGSNGTWGPGESTNKLLGAYLDNASTLTLRGLPTSGYDVAIIFAGDTDSSGACDKYSSVEVNGIPKTYNEQGELVDGSSPWGNRVTTSDADIMCLTETGTSTTGQVMYLSGMTSSTLHIKTNAEKNNTVGRGTIAAIQIYLKSGTFEKPSVELPAPAWIWNCTGGTDSGETVYGTTLYTVSNKVIDTTTEGLKIPANNFTFSYWSKMTDGANWRNYAGFSDTNGGLMIQKSAANRINIYNSGCVGEISPACMFTLSSTTPQLLTFVSKNGTLKVYVDGVYVSETTPTNWPSFAEANPMKYFGLGIAPNTSGGSAGNGYISAYVGDARVYREALSAEQVETLYLSYLSNYYSAAYPILSMDDDVDDDGMISKTELTAETAVGDADQFCISGAVTVNKGAGDPLNWSSLTLHAANVSSDSLTIAGENTLTATTTVIGVDTTVESGSASLGAVTVVGGMMLTVEDNMNAINSITNNGALRLTAASGHESAPVFDLTTRDALKNGSGKLLLDGENPLVVNLGALGTGMKIEVESGEHTIKTTGSGSSSPYPSSTINSPTIWVKSGATLHLQSKDLIGWRSSFTSDCVIRNSGNLIWEDNPGVSGSDCYSGQWILDNNAVLTIARTNTQSFAWRGGSESTPNVILTSGNAEITRSDTSKLMIHNTSTLYVKTGAEATDCLTISTPIDQSGTGSLTKTGAGTLKLTEQNIATGTLTVSNGTLDLTGSWAGPVTIAADATLAGSGTISGALTFNEGATLDTTEGPLTASGTVTVTLPSDLTVKITEEQEAAGAVTLLNAAEATIPDGMAVTVMVGETETVSENFYTVTHDTEADIVKLTIAERPVTDTVTATVPASGTYTLADALGVYALAANAKLLTIDFGETSGQSFTFDNDDAISFEQIIVTGTNGGTITKTGAGAVTVTTATTVNTNVTFGNGALPQGAIAIAEGKTLTLSAGTNEAYEGTITVANGATLHLPYGAGLTNPASSIVLEEGATILAQNGAGTSSTIASAITLNGAATIQGSIYGNDTNFSGVITGTGSLIIEKDPGASNPITFSGANTYDGGTTIAEGATLTITNAGAIGTGAITGEGTLVCDGVLPTNTTGLTNATNWTGTVKVQNFTGGTDAGAAELNLDAYGNANSVVELANVAGWVADGTVVENLKLSGSFSQNYGSTSAAAKVTINKLSGAGNFNGPSESDWQYGFIVNDCSEFTGSVNLKSGGHGGQIGMIIGAEPADYAHTNYKKHITVTADGKANVAEGATWAPATAAGGETRVYGTIGGEGTIASALTLADDATIDVANGVVTVDGAVTLPSALTVKITEEQDEVGSVTLLNAANVTIPDDITVSVKVGDGDTPAEGTYSLVATGSALQLVREEDAPVEPNVDTLVTADNTGIIELGTKDAGNGYHGVQVDLDVATPYGPGWDAKRVYVLEGISIADRSASSQISSDTTITVYESSQSSWTQVGPAGSGSLQNHTAAGFTGKDDANNETTWANFEFNTPILLDASKTYQFRFSQGAPLSMIKVSEIQGATNEQKDAVIALNQNGTDAAANFSPIVKLTATRKAVPNVSYVTDANTFSEKGNAGAESTGSATLSGDWALTASSVEFKTTGAVGETATILTPNVNVGIGGTWTLTFAPQDGEPRVVDAVSLDVVMFNSEGNKQTSSVQNRPLTLTVTDGTTELASYSGLLTGDDTVNPVVTATLNFAPTKVTQLQVTATRTDSTDAGCYYGISSFNVGTYEGATEVVEGNIPVEKGNVSDKSTSPMTKTDDSVWSVVSCKQLSTNADLGMKTGGAVGDDATIITPDVNVSNATSTAEGWALRYEADAPRKVESVTVTIQMFNGGGNVQNADNYTRAFKMTLKDVNGNELATTGDRTLQAVSGGSSRYPITLQIEPTELDTIVVEVSKGTADQGATGCFYGVSSFEVQLSQETTVLVNPTAWPSADMKLGAVYVGAEANLPAAPATQGGIYKAEVFRSLNAGALENWTIDAATENQTMMTFTQNASVTMARPEAPEALRPSTQAMSVHFDDTPYFGKLGIDYMPFTTATDVAILYVDSDGEIAYDSNAWWTSATEGAAATQGALGDKTPVLWLEGGTVVMTTGADAKPMTFHNETTNGTISIPAGVALAYGVTGEPSVSSPSIPSDVVVELGGALTMAGTLESVKLIGTGATLSGVNADNGDLTVTSIDVTAGTDLTIAGGNVMLTNPPETLAVNLNGGNLAVTASADTTATLAKLTVTRNANLTGDISVAQLGGTATLTSEDTLTVTGETTFGGSLNGVNLVVADGASMTLSGTSSVSTIAGAGTLTMQGATLTLTAPSTFGGTLSVGQFSTLTCNASLTIQKTLQFLDTQAYLKTTNEVWVTIASGATIIPNATQHAANMDIAAGAMIDLSGAGDVADGELKLEAVKLPAGAGQGAVTVKGSRTSTVIDTESPLPVGLLVSNFCLAEDDDTLHFLLDSSYDRVALVKVMADLSERTEEERQDILLLAYMLELPIGEIENPDVALLFDGEYNKAYGFETVPVYDAEETIIALNLRYFVKFGISDISNVRQSDGSLLADVTAVVEPLEESESVSFENGVVVALYVNGQDEPLRTVKIEDNDVRQVVFENVELPEFAEGTGTHELTVRVQSQQ